MLLGFWFGFSRLHRSTLEALNVLLSVSLFLCRTYSLFLSVSLSPSPVTKRKRIAPGVDLRRFSQQRVVRTDFKLATWARSEFIDRVVRRASLKITRYKYF